MTASARRKASMLLAGLLCLSSGAAAAAPAHLATSEQVTAFAETLASFARAANARWVVSAATLPEAEGVRAALDAALPDRLAGLFSRIEFRVGAEATAGDPTAWMEPQIGAAGDDPSCTWQVWVSDPGVPSPDERAAALPLAPGDRVPVGSAATFRVGYTGLLQSTVYAFGESGPGRIRDLARVTDINIPVLDAPAELLFLVRSRQPIAFLEGVRAALDDTGGAPRDLGPTFGLGDLVAGRTRGIGSNIQVLEPGMVIRGAAADMPAAATGGDLAETCLFTLFRVG